MIIGIAVSCLVAWLTVALSKQKNSVGYFLRGIKYPIHTVLTGFISLFAGLAMRGFNKLDYYPDRKGLTAVVTGGGKGMGVFVIKGLAKSGMRVIVGVRKPNLCEALSKEIKEENHPGSVEFTEIDTSSLSSVKAFADRVTKAHPEIHLLVNNAGVIDAPFKLTEDGFETHLATNYIGHFYLTHLLMKNLERAGTKGKIFSRIVNVSSCAHMVTPICYNDIHFKEEYHQSAAYGQSKLAQLMFSRYLNRDLESRQIPVRSYANHPGIVDTQMTTKFKSVPIVSLLMNMMKTPKEGAETILICCLSEHLEGTGGQFISDGREYYSTSFSKSETQQQKLFDFTTDLLKIKKFGVTE